MICKEMTINMERKVLRSRILEHFSPKLLTELNKVCASVKTSDNNIKTDLMLNILREYNLDFIELGPGTNRLAVLIDNYVFKIALDKWGVQDNWNEFSISEELQPYVIKTYEANGLIAVSEYITIISREEFDDRKEELRSILRILAESYLLGDVGIVGKNFLNWGYRDDGELVILDFAYIYRIKGEEMTCSKCNRLLEYDDNFYNLHCFPCNMKYTFTDIRRRIPMAEENRENFIALSLAYKLVNPIQTINVSVEEDLSSSNNIKEENDMSKGFGKFDEPEEIQEIDEYLEALERISGKSGVEKTKQIDVSLDSESTEVNLNAIPVNKPTGCCCADSKVISEVIVREIDLAITSITNDNEKQLYPESVHFIEATDTVPVCDEPINPLAETNQYGQGCEQPIQFEFVECPEVPMTEPQNIDLRSTTHSAPSNMTQDDIQNMRASLMSDINTTNLTQEESKRYIEIYEESHGVKIKLTEED